MGNLMNMVGFQVGEETHHRMVSTNLFHNAVEFLHEYYLKQPLRGEATEIESAKSVPRMTLLVLLSVIHIDRFCMKHGPEGPV